MTRREWYRRVYLHSWYWRWFSDAKRKRAGYTCQDCGCGWTGYEVHHRWYWLYLEWLIPWMTVVLCRDCHEARHGN